MKLNWPDLHYSYPTISQQALSLSSALSIINCFTFHTTDQQMVTEHCSLLYEQNVPFAHIHCVTLITIKCPQPCQYFLFHFPYNWPTNGYRTLLSPLSSALSISFVSLSIQLTTNGYRTLLSLIWAKCTLCTDTLCQSGNH